MADTITTPGDFVGMVGVAFGAEGVVATPVDASNPLPVTMVSGVGGDASASNQDEQTTELQTASAKLTLLDANLGAKADAAATTNTGTFSAIALLKRELGFSETIATAVADTTTPVPVKPHPGEFETVAASQTDAMMGATGAAGDRLDALLVIPATTSPGEISIEYGSTNIVVFAGGASSVSNLIPFLIPLGTQGIAAPSGGWEITTGANVSVIAFGDFT